MGKMAVTALKNYSLLGEAEAQPITQYSFNEKL